MERKPVSPRLYTHSQHLKSSQSLRHGPLLQYPTLVLTSLLLPTVTTQSLAVCAADNPSKISGHSCFPNTAASGTSGVGTWPLPLCHLLRPQGEALAIFPIVHTFSLKSQVCDWRWDHPVPSKEAQPPSIGEWSDPKTLLRQIHHSAGSMEFPKSGSFIPSVGSNRKLHLLPFQVIFKGYFKLFQRAQKV